MAQGKRPTPQSNSNPLASGLGAYGSYEAADALGGGGIFDGVGSLFGGAGGYAPVTPGAAVGGGMTSTGAFPVGTALDGSTMMSSGPNFAGSLAPTGGTGPFGMQVGPLGGAGMVVGSVLLGKMLGEQMSRLDRKLSGWKPARPLTREEVLASLNDFGRQLPGFTDADPGRQSAAMNYAIDNNLIRRANTKSDAGQYDGMSPGGVEIGATPGSHLMAAFWDRSGGGANIPLMRDSQGNLRSAASVLGPNFNSKDAPAIARYGGWRGKIGVEGDAAMADAIGYEDRAEKLRTLMSMVAPMAADAPAPAAGGAASAPPGGSGAQAPTRRRRPRGGRQPVVPPPPVIAPPQVIGPKVDQPAPVSTNDYVAAIIDQYRRNEGMSPYDNIYNPSGRSF